MSYDERRKEYFWDLLDNYGEELRITYSPEHRALQIIKDRSTVLANLSESQMTQLEIILSLVRQTDNWLGRLEAHRHE